MENKTSRNTEQQSKVNDFFFSSNFASEFPQTDRSEVFSLIDERVSIKRVLNLLVLKGNFFWIFFYSVGARYKSEATR